MAWTFDEKSPIYLQIAYRVKLKIASKELSMGQQLLPVREFAQEAGVNPNNMQRALADLERQGLLYTNRTSGRYVTEDEEMITKIRERIAEERICAFLESMSQLGFTQEQVLGLIQREREEKNA